jgi:hypothetical protein
MSTKIAFTVVMLAATMLAGCSDSAESARTTATSQGSPAVPTQQEAAQPIADRVVAGDQELVLNDDFVSPDASAALVTDDDSDSLADDADYEDDLLTDAIDPLADIDSPTAVEVTVVPTQTTSIFMTGRQLAYADAIRKRNERVYARRISPDVTEATAPTAPTAPAAATTVAPAPAPAVAVASGAPPPAVPLMTDKDIVDDEHGQWATTASASSTYGQPTQSNAPYAPAQVTGAPNVARYSDNPAAWTTKSGDTKDPEWLEVGFARPVHATSIRIRQTAAPGAIARIDLIDAEHVAHLLWEGTDDTPYVKNTIGWFVKDTPRTTYVVTGARITLMTARVWGYNEIDAVQLVGEE